MLEKIKQMLKVNASKTPQHIHVDLDEDIILDLNHLSMRFGGLIAVNDLSIQVRRGEIFGLIGPNGAGKTTVFNCITQFYKPTSGDAYFRGKNGNTIRLNDVKVHDVIKHGIIRTFQNVELVWELTVLQNLMVANTTKYHHIITRSFLHTPKMFQENQAIAAKALGILESLGLAIYKDVSPYGLPYGIRKKIELARTLMADPELIILDEPAAGLNDKETDELAETIKKIRDEYQTTIFLVEHDMPLVMGISDTVGAINFGKLIAVGTPKQIQENEAVRLAYLGSD
ncbi:MAG TPA: ABC transporter ATP-binding protein [Bacilli bacterium]|jgi:branched-chain amino acid transport system ATP-binding protein|nr:ABC transporter ATP-binding protein [Bacilli bacterium]